MSAKKKKRPPLPLVKSAVIDTHCHLDMAAYEEDMQQVVQRAYDAGVQQIITIGIDLESSRKAVHIAQQNEMIFASVGIHPHNVGDVTEADYNVIRQLASHPKVVAYGEIGIDRAKRYTPENQQVEHFVRQVRFAKELRLPLIIHDREAHGIVMDILKEEAPFSMAGVMHCFSGDVALAREVLDLGWYLSLPGVVTFKKADVMQEVARYVPSDRLLVETDGPFLAPEPMRGKRNEPAFVLYTLQHIARLRGETIDAVALQSSQNAQKLFGLSAYGGDNA